MTFFLITACLRDTRILKLIVDSLLPRFQVYRNNFLVENRIESIGTDPHGVDFLHIPFQPPESRYRRQIPLHVAARPLGQTRIPTLLPSLNRRSSHSSRRPVVTTSAGCALARRIDSRHALAASASNCLCGRHLPLPAFHPGRSTPRTRR